MTRDDVLGGLARITPIGVLLLLLMLLSPLILLGGLFLVADRAVLAVLPTRET